MDRTELLESALDTLKEGIALAQQDGRVALWNRTAETISGFTSAEVVGRSVRGVLVELRHKAGHDIPVVARVLSLRDGMGGRIGTGVVFHPAQRMDTCPTGNAVRNSSFGESQTEVEDRLATMHEDFLRSDISLGVLWVTVDQARGLRRTHGARACEAMLEKMERTLAGGLKPTEEIGRWGDDEFLVLSHERSAPMLAARAQKLAGLAPTTDFRWWGDRVSLTVSIGAAQAERGEPLSGLLERAQAAMLESTRTGGNLITAAQGRQACLPS